MDNKENEKQKQSPSAIGTGDYTKERSKIVKNWKAKDIIAECKKMKG